MSDNSNNKEFRISTDFDSITVQAVLHSIFETTFNTYKKRILSNIEKELDNSKSFMEQEFFFYIKGLEEGKTSVPVIKEFENSLKNMSDI